MIGILAQGGMGNEMFQFAFAYAAGKKLNTPFFIYKPKYLAYFNLYKNFKSTNFRNTLRFMRLNANKKSRYPLTRGSVKTPVRSLSNWAVNKNVYTWSNTIENENYLLTKPEDNVLYDGFFQSEEYFNHCKEDIKNTFEIKKKHQAKFLSRKGHLFEKKSIAIHLRRGDYIEYGGDEVGGYDMRLPAAFYKKCLSLIKNIELYNILFVSDDIEFVKKEFGEHKNYFYENNDALTDFQLLLNADVVIIANSTFSWWAAWLNNKADKIVYAPNYFLGFRVNRFYPAGIKVNDWNWIDVN